MHGLGKQTVSSKAQKVSSVMLLRVPVLTPYFADNSKHSKGSPVWTGSTGWPTHVVLAAAAEPEVVVAVAVAVALPRYNVEEKVEYESVVEQFCWRSSNCWIRYVV